MLATIEYLDGPMQLLLARAEKKTQLRYHYMILIPWAVDSFSMPIPKTRSGNPFEKGCQTNKNQIQYKISYVFLGVRVDKEQHLRHIKTHVSVKLSERGIL